MTLGPVPLGDPRSESFLKINLIETSYQGIHRAPCTRIWRQARELVPSGTNAREFYRDLPHIPSAHTERIYRAGQPRAPIVARSHEPNPSLVAGHRTNHGLAVDRLGVLTILLGFRCGGRVVGYVVWFLSLWGVGCRVRGAGFSYYYVKTLVHINTMFKTTGKHSQTDLPEFSAASAVAAATSGSVGGVAAATSAAGAAGAAGVSGAVGMAGVNRWARPATLTGQSRAPPRADRRSGLGRGLSLRV